MSRPTRRINRRAALPAETIRDLYVDRAWTLDRNASHVGLSPITVRRRMHDLGIPARPRGPSQNHVLGRFRTVWSPDLAYVVGIIATDGNLSSDRRHLSITSKDVDLLETVQRCLRLDVSITPHRGAYGRCLRLQWGDRVFYDWLLSIGLMPAKSLRLESLSVPDEFFRDFVRGCIDGDGSIITYRDRFNTSKNPTYVYERVFVSIVSASRPFLEWIRGSVQRLRGLSGHLTVQTRTKHHALFRLRYAKRESFGLLTWLYYAGDVAALRRKRDRATAALANLTWYRRTL